MRGYYLIVAVGYVGGGLEASVDDGARRRRRRRRRREVAPRKSQFSLFRVEFPESASMIIKKQV
jgi:hypothetical protein